jgi:hypothetical protein
VSAQAQLSGARPALPCRSSPPTRRSYLNEANANPDICAIEDFAEAAEKQGMSYNELVQLIVRAGVNYQAPWKAGPTKKYV